MNFGESAPHLRMRRSAAVHILSQTTSSNCERNWSTFSLIHTKARNRLTMHKLNKLVYCHYNLKLRNRIRERRARDDPAYCPINLDHIFVILTVANHKEREIWEKYCIQLSDSFGDPLSLYMGITCL